MPAEFRPARPEDVAAVVPLIYASGPVAFDYVFGPSHPAGAKGFIARAFVDPAGQFSYTTHTVGVRSGAVVASGAIWDSSVEIPFLLAALRQFIGQFGLVRGAATGIRGLMAETVLKPPRKGEMAINFVAVQPDLRGIGVGAALLEELVSQARARGAERAVLDVAVTNPRAEALYLRQGFHITAERHRNLKNAHGEIVLHKRMERVL